MFRKTKDEQQEQGMTYTRYNLTGIVCIPRYWYIQWHTRIASLRQEPTASMSANLMLATYNSALTMKSTRRQPRKGRSAKALSGKSYYLNMECIQQLEHIKVTNQWDILNIACYAAGNNSLLCTGYPNTSIYAKNGGSKALPDANIHQIWWVFGNTSCLQAARASKIEMNHTHKPINRFSTYTKIWTYVTRDVLNMYK